jgi:hypothetical protein
VRQRFLEVKIIKVKIIKSFENQFNILVAPFRVGGKSVVLKALIVLPQMVLPSLLPQVFPSNNSDFPRWRKFLALMYISKR